MVDPLPNGPEETTRRRMSGITFDTGALIALVDQKDPGDLEALRDGVPLLPKIKVTRA
jgi:hypothetical protein